MLAPGFELMLPDHFVGALVKLCGTGKRLGSSETQAAPPSVPVPAVTMEKQV